MATTDITSAQFQEPPVGELSEATATATNEDSNIDAQFQEPISPPISNEPSTSTSTSISNATDGGALYKSTSEKLKDAVKKPFSSTFSDDNEEKERLGHKRITSPEMAAANEVLKAQDLKSS